MDGNWGDDVFAMFDHGAQAEAMKQIPVLTAGTAAGDAFTTITPVKSNLRSKVLFDPKDEPYSVIAIVKFKATGSGKDGQDLLILSKGQYVFQKIDGSWKVVLAVSGGASITIEGGSFTAQCPGKITVQAGMKSMVGGGTQSWAMPTMPNSICVSCLLAARASGSALAKE